MSAAPTIVVWDPLVRLLHWALLATFIVAYLSPAGRSVVHETAGYIVALIVVVRIVWGFTGPVHARLRSFVVGPAKLGAYLWALVIRKEPRFLGHNPAGAAMILLLWALLTAICVSGWLLTWQSFRDHRVLQDWHGTLSDVMVVAATLHVLGVIYASVRHRENLIASMFTGRKRIE